MNSLTDNPNNALQDFFFRTADRMRVEGCANAIANEGLSLVLYSPHEALLDHYLGLLLERLRRQTPQPRVEVYFPTSTESLIARFNDVLAKQSVKEATRLPQDNDSAQIWIVHDTQQLPDQEIQLMARLIQNFPGANIRAILLMTGNNPQKASLSAMGRKVLRWDIEAPTAEQAQLALDAAAPDGQRQAVTQLLRRMGRLPDADMDLGSEVPGMAEVSTPDAPKSSLTTRGLGVLARWREQPSQWIRQIQHRIQGAAPKGAASGLKGQTRLPLVLGAALLVSVGVMAWVQPQAFGLSRKATVQPTPVPPPVQPSPVAQAVAASEPAPEVPDESQQTQAWVRSLPSNSFLIQHASVMTYEKAVAMNKTMPAQANARIVAAYRPGESLAHFVIVSGPFDSLGKAYESIKRKEATKNSWVRATKTLQDQITGPTRPQEVRP